MKQYLLCELCGNLKQTNTNTICCGKPMKLVKANTTDAASEKHVPVINIAKDKVIVNVGKIPHPMEENHYIKWIYLQTTKQIYQKSLKPGFDAKSEFILNENELVLSALAYCNLHSLWIKTKD